MPGEAPDSRLFSMLNIAAATADGQVPSEEPTSDIRFGALLFTSRFGPMTDTDVFAQTLSVADAAAAAGFDALWTNEHHFIRYGLCPNALTLAGYLAGRTGLPVGTAVTLLPQHNPVRVAEEAAMLDHLTGGDFTLGLGRGGPVVDYEVFAGGLANYERGIDEAIDIVQRCWAGEVDADTDLYRFRPVNPLPQPLTTGGPTVKVAATSDAGVERAARLGASMLLFFHQGPETIAELVTQHAELAEANRHPPCTYDHSAALIVQVADSDEEAAALVREPVTEFLIASNSEYVPIDGAHMPRHHQDDASIQAFTEKIIATQPIGNPETVAERLVSMIRISGCRSLLLKVENGPNPDQAVANVARLGAEVLPQVRAALGSSSRTEVDHLVEPG